MLAIVCLAVLEHSSRAHSAGSRPPGCLEPHHRNDLGRLSRTASPGRARSPHAPHPDSTTVGSPGGSSRTVAAAEEATVGGSKVAGTRGMAGAAMARVEAGMGPCQAANQAKENAAATLARVEVRTAATLCSPIQRSG
eukprot:2954939-Prymnesium_polylepis.1